MHCYKKLLIFFSIIFLGPSASTTTTTTTLPSGNVFWRYSQKKILKKIRTWLTSLHYTRAKQKKILSKKKNRENAAKTISPPNHKKMVSTLCLPLPYYLWKGVACNQLHSVSFCEFPIWFYRQLFTWGYHLI